MCEPELNHYKLELAKNHNFIGVRPERLEVWDDRVSNTANTPCVTLYNEEETRSVDLTPREARALAALLIVAADNQERRFAAQQAIRSRSQEQHSLGDQTPD